MELPGLKPMSLLTVVRESVFVTVVAPRMPKVAAVPRLMPCAVMRRGNERQQAIIYAGLMTRVERDVLETDIVP